MNTQNNVKGPGVREIAEIGLMIALIEACKLALSFLPNIELTSFFVIMFTLYFGRKIAFVIPGFILIEGCLYGFGLWWLMYAYVWPLLALIAFLLRNKTGAVLWACVSGTYGLCFGFLCSFPYFFMGLSTGVRSGLISMITWWGAGIPWDIVHGVGNFALMLALYKPVTKILNQIKAKNE